MSAQIPSSATGGPPGWPDGLHFRASWMGVARVALTLAVVALIAGLGFAVGRSAVSREKDATAKSTKDALFWTCSMHPQIHKTERGQCPICFMDLIPVYADSSGDGGRIALSPRAMRLAQVETVEVQPHELAQRVDLVGKAAADESRITYISSYIPGRLDKLYVNFTGGLVRKGDHLAEIYSPQLLVSQREYLMAHEAVKKAGAPASGPGGAAQSSSQSMLDAARTRLELWGVPRDQIQDIERRGVASDHMRIDAPQEGWVIERNAYEGMYAETGMRLFSLVDLRQIWVMLSAFEQDLALLRLGQAVEFEAEAHPGRVFAGKIAYIDPTLSESTRTVKVRVNVPNADLALKPGMFVRARVAAKIGERGQVLGPPLAGKWVCYMHPDVVKDGPGKCDICGMDLVTAESLGMAGDASASSLALAVPQTAVLLTGRRALVYVERLPSAEPSGGRSPPAASSGSSQSALDNGTYEPREIELGPHVGDEYVVLGGLIAGERVVVRGAAQIDSAVQIRGKRSMMQAADTTVRPVMGTPDAPKDGAKEPGIASRAIKAAGYHATAAPLIRSYLALTAALAADKPADAPTALAEFRKAADALQPEGLEGAAADDFRSQISNLKSAIPPADSLAAADKSSAITAVREALPKLTLALYRFLRTFGHDRADAIVRVFCPMAFEGKGAEWLQSGDEVRNPYFGEKMLRCGQIRGHIAADGTEAH